MVAASSLDTIERQLAALREENARLRQRVEELEQTAARIASEAACERLRAEAAEEEARLNRAAAEKHYAYGEAMKELAEAAEAEMARLRERLAKWESQDIHESMGCYKENQRLRAALLGLVNALDDPYNIPVQPALDAARAALAPEVKP